MSPLSDEEKRKISNLNNKNQVVMIVSGNTTVKPITRNLKIVTKSPSS